MIFHIRDVMDWSVSAQLADGRWVPARPMRGPFIWRVRFAWGVLTGRYDALKWDAQ